VETLCVRKAAQSTSSNQSKSKFCLQKSSKTTLVRLCSTNNLTYKYWLTKNRTDNQTGKRCLLRHYSHGNKDILNNRDVPAPQTNCCNHIYRLIPPWETGDSLALPDIAADKSYFQTVPNRRLTFYWACISVLQQQPRCSCTLKPHTSTLMDAISIFHGQGALKLTGLRISALCSLHYSLPSLVAGLVCVDKGLDGRLQFRLELFLSLLWVVLHWNDINPPFSRWIIYTARGWRLTSI